MKQLTCIVCPKGCRLTLVADTNAEGGYRIEGNFCAKGIAYALEEGTHPMRTLTTTVSISGAPLRRLPARTAAPIPKERVMDVMQAINKFTATAPVHIGQVLIQNILGLGVDLVATRDMENK